MKPIILTGIFLTVFMQIQALVEPPSNITPRSTMTPAPSQTQRPPTTPPRIQPVRPKLIIPDSERTITKPTGELFSYPGMVTIKDNQWTGFDNFVNISHSMAVQVNIVKPQEMTLEISTEELKNKIISIFQSNGIAVTDTGSEGKPPLPYFNMLVMVYPLTEGFAAACVARLFEEVNLQRLRLKGGEVFQAITWTQANLVVSPQDQFLELLNKTIENMSSNFARRVSGHQVQEKPQELERLSPEELKL